MSRPLIIIGASARAAAQSAIRAGYQPWCIDLFADRDLQAIAPVQRCPWDDYPQGILKLLEQAPAAPLLCTGGMEKYPDLLEAIARRWTLLGCPPAAIRSVRKPRSLSSIPSLEGLRLCGIREAIREPRRVVAVPDADTDTRWLVKTRLGAGGGGVRWWNGQERLADGEFLQEFADGVPMSALYHATECRCVFLGGSEQLVGAAEFGGKGFQYCGSIGSSAWTAPQRRVLEHLGAALTKTHGLRGLFGVDFILNPRGNICPVEVNPRYPASTELIERATGVAALAEPAMGARTAPPPWIQPSPLVHGKAILFAKLSGRVPDLYDLFADNEVADVGAAGEIVPAGRPICTVFAAGPTPEACLAGLRERARRLYTRPQT